MALPPSNISRPRTTASTEKPTPGKGVLQAESHMLFGAQPSNSKLSDAFLVCIHLSLWPHKAAHTVGTWNEDPAGLPLPRDPRSPSVASMQSLREQGTEKGEGAKGSSYHKATDPIGL